MTLELTKNNMQLLSGMWKKPLSDKEINDFLISEPLINEEYEKIEHAKKWATFIHNRSATKIYTTKKSIRQDIKTIDDQLELWLKHSQLAVNEMGKIYAEIHLEDLFKEKDKLKEKLRYVGVKFSNNRLAQAKERPISDFLLFNGAGFAKCLWHPEHTPSLHLIKASNKVYCFGCAKTADVIDVVMEVNNCELPEALKIILEQ